MRRLFKILIPVVVIIVIIAIVVPIAVVFTRSEEEGENYPQVDTTVGKIRGLRNEDGSAMFLGIPYAYVNESNPFGATHVHPTFENVFEAVNDSVRCPQIPLEGTSLDCLHLNIHVPKRTDNKPLPVFVYIFGGGFIRGSAGRNNIGPKFLIQHDVIFVSFNYRLSAYGFMCLNIPEVPGNQGLKDQLNALRWLKKNIKSFGGDDENITISGDSAGGISVHLLLLFAETGLFQKVITQSGTAFSPWIFNERNVNAPLIIADRLGFETNDTSEALAYLSNRTSDEVMSVVGSVESGNLFFGPCVEDEFPNVERLISSYTINTPSVNAQNISMLSGYNDDEWLLIYGNMPLPVIQNLDLFNRNLNFDFEFGDKHDSMKLFVRRFYAADEPMSENLRRAVIDFDSDFIVNHPTQRTIRQHLDHGGVVYHYVFSYVGDRSMLRRGNLTGGAAHSDELRYLYDMPDHPESPTPRDQLIIDRITTLWTNFAKYGNPTPTTSELLPIQWLPVTEDRLNYLDINEPLALRTRPHRQRLSFWDFFYRTNREYIRLYSNETLTS